jgi:hypothetical protein
MQKHQIIDNIIMVQEAIHSSRENKDKGMIIKIDMANAFDQVRHSFLLVDLCKFGFNYNFVQWVKACISNPWISPLFNGRPTNFFKRNRGLRQGCPLSPLLYIIMGRGLD